MKKQKFSLSKMRSRSPICWPMASRWRVLKPVPRPAVPQALGSLRHFIPICSFWIGSLPTKAGSIYAKVTTDYNIPIFMITAKSDITDKVLGLEFGADDYITKPFDLREVIARIRTILRRLDQANQGDRGGMPEAVIRFRDIEIVMEERLVKKDGRSVDLTPKEFDLLLTLYGHRGKFIHARNCWIWSGDMILLGIPGRWIRIFRGSAKTGCRRFDHNRIRHRL